MDDITPETEKQSTAEKAKAAMRKKKAETPEPVPPPFEDAEPEPESEPPASDVELREEFMAQAELIAAPDKLDQHASTVDACNELTEDSKKIIHAVIQKRRAKLTRGENSNTGKQSEMFDSQSSATEAGL